MPQEQKKRVRTTRSAKQQAEGPSCCATTVSKGTCCKVEALVSVDERGQMILPKELRDKANIRAGDKLALTSLERNGKLCCMLLTRADDLSGMVVTVLGPVVKNMT